MHYSVKLRVAFITCTYNIMMYFIIKVLKSNILDTSASFTFAWYYTPHQPEANAAAIRKAPCPFSTAARKLLLPCLFASFAIFLNQTPLCYQRGLPGRLPLTFSGLR